MVVRLLVVVVSVVVTVSKVWLFVDGVEASKETIAKTSKIEVSVLRSVFCSPHNA
jgi:hypothetical protein